MRIKTYLRKMLDTGDVERLPFEHGHFALVGYESSFAFGLPELEALRLVNRWNIAQDHQRIVYALE